MILIDPEPPTLFGRDGAGFGGGCGYKLMINRGDKMSAPTTALKAVRP